MNKNDGPIIATLALLLDLVLIYKATAGPGTWEAYVTLLIGVPSAFVLMGVAAFLWGRSR